MKKTIFLIAFFVFIRININAQEALDTVRLTIVSLASDVFSGILPSNSIKKGVEDIYEIYETPLKYYGQGVRKSSSNNIYRVIPFYGINMISMAIANMYGLLAYEVSRNVDKSLLVMDNMSNVRAYRIDGGLYWTGIYTFSGLPYKVEIIYDSNELILRFLVSRNMN